MSTARSSLADARLYLCTDARTRQGDLPEFLDAVLASGVDIVQLRDKGLEAAEELEHLQVFADACRRHGRLLAVNDRADVAHAIGSDVLHLGQGDLPVPAARAILGADPLIGRSTHAEAEVDAAAAEPGVDYFCTGPCWPTPTKPGRHAPGLGLVRYAAVAGHGPPVVRDRRHRRGQSRRGAGRRRPPGRGRTGHHRGRRPGRAAAAREVDCGRATRQGARRCSGCPRDGQHRKSDKFPGIRLGIVTPAILPMALGTASTRTDHAPTVRDLLAAGTARTRSSSGRPRPRRASGPSGTRCAGSRRWPRASSPSPTARAAPPAQGTVKATEQIAADTTLTPVAHLTAVDHSVAELRNIIGQYADAGIRNILAVRGDPPGDPMGEWVAHPEGRALRGRTGPADQGVRRLLRGRRRLPRDAPALGRLGHRHRALRRQVPRGRRLRDHADVLRPRVATCGCATGSPPPVARRRSSPRSCRSRASGSWRRLPQLSNAVFPPELKERILAVKDDPAAVRSIGIEFATEFCATAARRGRPRAALHYTQQLHCDARNLRESGTARAVVTGRTRPVTGAAAAGEGRTWAGRSSTSHSASSRCGCWARYCCSTRRGCAGAPSPSPASSEWSSASCCPISCVIVLGAIAFAVGQTYVTLSFRRGFSTGWALGGSPGESRRRKGGRRGRGPGTQPRSLRPGVRARRGPPGEPGGPGAPGRRQHIGVRDRARARGHRAVRRLQRRRLRVAAAGPAATAEPAG